MLPEFLEVTLSLSSRYKLYLRHFMAVSYLSGARASGRYFITIHYFDIGSVYQDHFMYYVYIKSVYRRQFMYYVHFTGVYHRQFMYHVYVTSVYCFHFKTV